MNNVVKSLFILLSAMLLVSCASTDVTTTMPVEERYQKAKALFDDEDYLQAIEDFKVITVQFQGSEYADEAQFYLAECRYRRGEFILASAEYDNLVRLMPGSPFTNLARYMRADSYYQLSPKPQLDQKYSRMALDNFQTYIEFSPKDTLVGEAEKKITELTLKLAMKMYEGGLLYYRMEYFRAAIAYFDKLIQDYHDSPYADDGMLWKARSQNERKDFAGAVQTIQELLTKHPGTDLKPEIAELEKRIAEDKAEYDEDQRLRQTTLTE